MALARRAFLALIPLALAACSKSFPAQAGEDTPAWTAGGGPLAGRHVSQAELQRAAGFTVGRATARRTVYVMFDPQCPHCAQVWRSSKVLWPRARFVWIPVGLMRDVSSLQGAALLQSTSPAALMDEHEALLSQRAGGLSVKETTLTEASRDAVERNTLLLAGFGAERVPFIVGTDEKTGRLIAIEGEVGPDVLAARLGWPAGDTQ